MFSLSVQFTVPQFPFVSSFFLSSSPTPLLVFLPLAFSTLSLGSLLNSLPIALLLAPCPIRALIGTRGGVLRECQLHLAENKLEVASSGGPEWRVGRL